MTIAYSHLVSIVKMLSFRASFVLTMIEKIVFVDHKKRSLNTWNIYDHLFY